MSNIDLHKLRRGWAVQIRVVHALMIRELSTRFGRQNIGFLWIMVEPLLFAGMVALIWRLSKGPEEHGVSIIAFVVTGYIPITLFRHGISRSVAVFTANGALLYHRQIKLVDFILVRFVIEVLGGMMAYVFIGAILILFDEFPVPSNIGLLIGGWMIYALFSFSLCLIIAPLSEMSEVVEKFVPVLTYIMIPFSGLFFMVSWLTPEVRDYILMSPFVNAMEMMREGIWGNKLTAHYNAWYPIACSMVAILIGLPLCRHVRRTLAVE
ncbi:ABC transporter permease [soil metagenome]|uniref:ABC transporter permease n=1 Tax=Sphingobium sp. BS19 TaxID=3018973 RepID=UPI0022EEE3B6|nr:ABC transporter permease [Sphingobium sp. BS19]GLJ00347.1 capsule polysaccharide export inner-membrane protein CtrC [Sphingobium sp. BS19]